MNKYFTLLAIATLLFSCTNKKLKGFTEPDLSSKIEKKQHNILSYEKGIVNNGYKSSIIYYPDIAQLKVIPVVIITHGYLSDKEKLTWLSKKIASRGFVVMAVTGLNSANPATTPRKWVENYEASFSSIIAENERKESVLYKKLDLNKISIIGHSMGGGGSLHFADETNRKIKSIIALAPFCLERKKPGANINVPTMVMAGSMDILASPVMTKKIFNEIATKEKKYAYFKGAGHAAFERGFHKKPEIAEVLFEWLNKYGK